jgi:hypothetical protein
MSTAASIAALLSSTPRRLDTAAPSPISCARLARDA